MTFPLNTNMEMNVVASKKKTMINDLIGGTTATKDAVRPMEC